MHYIYVPQTTDYTPLLLYAAENVYAIKNPLQNIKLILSAKCYVCVQTMLEHKIHSCLFFRFILYFNIIWASRRRDRQLHIRISWMHFSFLMKFFGIVFRFIVALCKTVYLKIDVFI